MIKKNKNIFLLSGVFLFIFLYSLSMQGAKLAMAVKKNFVFQGKEAQAIATLLHFSATQKQNYKLRLNSTLEWAVYLRDTPNPDASSSSTERPRFNQITYDPASNRIEISGDFFDKNTGIPISDFPRYYFMSDLFPLNEVHTSEWWKLIEPFVPSKLIKDEKNLYAETVYQKKISLDVSNEIEVKILLAWDYTQNIKKPALQVSIALDAK